MITEQLINPEEVGQVFKYCLCEAHEIAEGDSVAVGAIVVEGIRGSFTFHVSRLEEHRARVQAWLKALPREFRKEIGGGWSLLNSCMEANGRQWTGYQARAEQLFCLGMGLGIVEYLVPREMWGGLSGGMPYYVITVD